MKTAADNFARGISYCSPATRATLDNHYLGTSSAGNSTRTDGKCNSADYTNIVGWRGFSNLGLLGLTCWRANSSGAITGADIAIQPRVKWWRSGSCSGAYDFHAVAMHEFGHAFGLDHVSQSSKQLMSPYFDKCELGRHKLKSGDLLGVHTLAGKWL